MSPWSVLIGSLRKERPPAPDFLKGGRNKVSLLTIEAAREAHRSRRLKTKKRILDCLSDEREWTTAMLTRELEIDLGHISRLCLELLEEGKIFGYQHGPKKTWFWSLVKI